LLYAHLDPTPRPLRRLDDVQELGEVRDELLRKHFMAEFLAELFAFFITPLMNAVSVVSVVEGDLQGVISILYMWWPCSESLWIFTSFLLSSTAQHIATTLILCTSLPRGQPCIDGEMNRCISLSSELYPTSSSVGSTRILPSRLRTRVTLIKVFVSSLFGRLMGM
jgi:hypothetical protein